MIVVATGKRAVRVHANNPLGYGTGKGSRQSPQQSTVKVGGSSRTYPGDKGLLTQRPSNRHEKDG